MSDSTAAAADIAPLTGVRLALGAFGLALANFIVILDTTVTNVSVPHIAGSLAISPSQGTWTITSYAVAEAITVPLSGWLANRFGPYRLLLVSLAGFATFSVLCGLCRTIELLVVMRICQGLCGGPLMPITQTFLMRIFPPEKMGTANAIWGVTAISAPIIGPIVGGWLSDNWSWPWIFFINLPVVILSFLLIQSLIARYEQPGRREPIDTTGLTLLVLFVGGFQLVLDLGREYDWFASPMIVAIAIVSAIAFVAFVIWELTDDHPVVDLRILRHRTMWVGLILVACGYGGLFSMIVLVPLWLQSALGYSASEAGHLMAFIGVLAVMMAPVAGKLIQHVDMRILITLGMAWLAFTAILRTGWTPDGTFIQFATPQLLQGLGMPFFFIGSMTFALSSVPSKDFAGAAGLLSFVRTMSGAVGTALATSAWDDATRGARADMAGSLNGGDAALSALQDQGLGTEQGRAVLERMIDVQAMTIGSTHVYWISAIVMTASILLVWVCPRPQVASGGRMGAH
jgi:DHA2 family multidrug resistance protein